MTRLFCCVSSAQQVEFVIIGGVCGIMHGVTLVTTDLDVCCRFVPENLHRLQAAVKDLHPYHRLAANKLPLELTDELCGRLKNLYLQTDLGKARLPRRSGRCWRIMRLCCGILCVFKLSYGEFRILDLDALIASKEAVGRERDLAAVRQLRAIKERLQARKT